jgi:MFS family permease
MTIRALFKTPLFWLAIILMVCAGASELSMAQWASAFTEAALGFSKTVSDLVGPCLFAVTMGISRVVYGKYGAKMNLMRFMIASGILCLCCYLLASLCASPVLGLIGCIFCGFSVGIMWPGSLSKASATLPTGGTAMFALLALSGDIGCTVGSTSVGLVSDAMSGNIQLGILAAIVFPVVLLLCVLKRKK